jgi:hypothetical protein
VNPELQKVGDEEQGLIQISTRPFSYPSLHTYDFTTEGLSE